MVRGYLSESEWLKEGQVSVASVKEYLGPASMTSNMTTIKSSFLMGMGEIAGAKEFKWLFSDPKICEAVALTIRIRNDIQDHQDYSDDEGEEHKHPMEISMDGIEISPVDLRKKLYLTIMSSLDFEEAGYKLLKITKQLEQSGQEVMELCNMIFECCGKEINYHPYYGLLGQRFYAMNQEFQEKFEQLFVQQHSHCHRLETSKLHNVGKFFAHLLATDASSWRVLGYVRLTEEDTNSSSRVLIKILFQEMSELLGIRRLKERLMDPTMQDLLDQSVFPSDDEKSTRFAINFFTAIGLGGITEELRKDLDKLRYKKRVRTAESSEKRRNQRRRC